MKSVLVNVFIAIAISFGEAQREGLPFTAGSFKQLTRMISDPPGGRTPTSEDIIIRYYHTNVTFPISRRIGNIKQFLDDPGFDVTKPTVVYGHGYLEVYTDVSVVSVTSAYLRAGGYNVMVVDWSNIGIGNYFLIAKQLPMVGQVVGKALQKLLKRGLSLQGLHIIGHSMGGHLMAYAARYLDSRGLTVPRLTALDPAYPLYYPPAMIVPHISASDATFVDVIHTDGGYFGTPTKTGHADFWPNAGQAKQPGCISATIPFTTEDFCSHWRSWALWAESVNSDDLIARRCSNYDSFLRASCDDQPIVYMGLKARSDLRGNFYLRTATKSPYGLGLRGIS